MKNPVPADTLASFLQTESTALLDFFDTQQLGHLVSDNHISFCDIPTVLAAFRSHFELQNQAWPIPDWLASDCSASARTLAKMYTEPVSYPASLPPSQGRLVHDIILQTKPAVSVEIGCFIGISSIWISSALQKLRSGYLYSVDLFDPKFPAPPWHWSFLEDPMTFAVSGAHSAGLSDYVNFVKTNSASFAKDFKEHTPEMIDFLFIDGDHSVAGCLDDFVSYYPHVKTGGTILLHDIYPEHCGWTGPRYLLDHVVGNSTHFQITEIDTEPNFGMALITKRKDHWAFHPWRNPRLELIRQPHRAGINNFLHTSVKPIIKSLFSFNKT